MEVDKDTLDRTLELLTRRLLSFRTPQGHWTGRLSSSALSTATAVAALALTNAQEHQDLIGRGLDWLAENRNADGGWGDTADSPTNLSTTILVWAAFAAARKADAYENVLADAQAWLGQHLGSLEPRALAQGLNRRYGRDRTFSAPILTMCALAGRLGDAKDAWPLIKPLPFELAACPHQLFRRLRLTVVSYALPALIAVGQVNFHYRKPKNPVTRGLRCLTRNKTLKVLRNMQPPDGGFLEAVPLTSFVAMCLVHEANAGDIVGKAVDFIKASVRDDGSWPIDTNLATWVTTLSVNALAANPGFEAVVPVDDRAAIAGWLVSQQHRAEHPYTRAVGGGWAWSDLPGAVPDADDTAGALLALRNLSVEHPRLTEAVTSGIKWLLDLQNCDGGVGTFCKGWNRLEFDRSAPDLTAHTIAAIHAWLDMLDNPLKHRATKAIYAALDYLACAQGSDGSWLPLWFGNQHAPNQQNPVYGTARVVTAVHNLPMRFIGARAGMLQAAAKWLLAAQNTDGGWGGAKSVQSSIEEIALATDALASLLVRTQSDSAFAGRLDAQAETLEAALAKAASWLINNVGTAEGLRAAPIGLYFARLWYCERLYPYIFAVSALEKVRNLSLVK